MSNEEEATRKFLDPDNNPLLKEYHDFLASDGVEDTAAIRHAFFAGTASGLATAKRLYSKDEAAFVERLGQAIIISATLTGGYTKAQLKDMLSAHHAGMLMFRACRSEESQP